MFQTRKNLSECLTYFGSINYPQTAQIFNSFNYILKYLYYNCKSLLIYFKYNLPLTCFSVMQPELYTVMEILCKISFVTAFILHSNNWLVYAWSMKIFRDDMKKIITLRFSNQFSTNDRRTK